MKWQSSTSPCIIKPTEGNYEHWALYLENGSETKIYEVVGETPNFTKNVLDSRPTATNRHKRSVLMATLNASDLPTFRQAIDNASPDNSTALWNCQDYVMEILENLEEECVLDDEDEDYVKAKKEVKKYYGPLV